MKGVLKPRKRASSGGGRAEKTPTKLRWGGAIVVDAADPQRTFEACEDADARQQARGTFLKKEAYPGSGDEELDIDALLDLSDLDLSGSDDSDDSAESDETEAASSDIPLNEGGVAEKKHNVATTDVRVQPAGKGKIDSEIPSLARLETNRAKTLSGSLKGLLKVAGDEASSTQSKQTAEFESEKSSRKGGNRSNGVSEPVEADTRSKSNIGRQHAGSTGQRDHKSQNGDGGTAEGEEGSGGVKPRTRNNKPRENFATLSRPSNPGGVSELRRAYGKG